MPTRFSIISLPNWVVMSDTVHTFKNRLDRFWHDQPIIYDFKADIQGTGNRSWYLKLAIVQ